MSGADLTALSGFLKAPRQAFASQPPTAHRDAINPQFPSTRNKRRRDGTDSFTAVCYRHSQVIPRAPLSASESVYSITVQLAYAAATHEPFLRNHIGPG